jgi:DNA-binding transcriptional LysR family regulator
MELKWLEDFASLARTGSFSRSAEERAVTQSAFSRRIRALEAWLGVALVDRSTYPTTLTEAGRSFRETAEEAIRVLDDGRAALRASIRPGPKSISVAALHTLALSFFPGWFRGIEDRTGPLGSRLLPADFHGCVQALVEGGYDFLLTFHHPGVPILLDPERFPHRVVGTDALVTVRSAPGPSGAGLRELAYERTSFLGRLAALAREEADPAEAVHTNESAMAEALKAMTLEGHGWARLPRSLIVAELEAGRLVRMGDEIPLEIRLYRNAAHRRPILGTVWQAAGALAAPAMHDRTGSD